MAQKRVKTMVFQKMILVKKNRLNPNVMGFGRVFGTRVTPRIKLRDI